MNTIRQNEEWSLRCANRILLLCLIPVSCVLAAPPRPAAAFGTARVIDPRFTHLTTNDGLSQSSVTEIQQDRRGFMWFATRDGLNRYDGNTFVVYKHNPNDPASLSSNFVLDLMEDDQGYLWIATDFGGVNKFDPATERFVHYRHDPNNRNSLSGDSVETIARDSQGRLWFGTVDSGLDRFDPRTGAFTHYVNDSDGKFVGRITKAIAGRQGDIWFVGERGLFHLNPETGQITRPPETIAHTLAADYVYEDDAGNLWMLAWSPIVGLVKYDRGTGRLTTYPFGAGAVGVASSNLLADGQDGLWVPSSLGLFYFNRRTERFTSRLQHDETNPNSLDDNTVVAIYQDRGGLLWAGTGSGLNLLNFRQQQFGQYRHLPNSPNSLSPGKVTAIYEDPNNILWVGFLPRALNRVDRKTGEITRYLPGPESTNALSKGMNVVGIYKDTRGYLWLGGWGSGLDRFDERTGQFKHYRHRPDDSNSLISDSVYTIYGDRDGHIWVGQLYGLSRLDPVTEQFTNYRLDTNNPTWNGSSVSCIYQDRSGTVWLGTAGGALVPIDDKAGTLLNNPPDSRHAHKLNGGAITAIHEDQTGTFWVGAWDGLYRYNRENRTFTRYTENQGLSSSGIMGILEDKTGRLWLSTKHGISRFDPRTETFRNYDVSDGLQGDEFSAGACVRGVDGEMFFGGGNGLNAFLAENVRDNPYAPPVVITGFKIFNKPVPIDDKSVLTKAISYANGLTLSYRQNVFSFEFTALSYANSRKNRYRYKLEDFDPGWNEVGSQQRLATYTNLDPGKYVFRVQGSNSDGVWNEEGVSLPIVITPPWWSTNWFRILSVAVFLALLWAAYRYRVRQLEQAFNIRVEGRVEERARIARDLHDTLLQSFQGLIPVFQTARNLLPVQSERAANVLDEGLRDAAEAIVEGRNAIQNLRAKPSLDPDLGSLLNAAGSDLAQSPEAGGSAPAFRVVVEGARLPLAPLLRDEIYRIGREVLRNAYRHAHASRIEAEIRYDRDTFRLRIRDDGKGIDSSVLQEGTRAGHWGLPGMHERAQRIGARLKIWSESGAGTEVELTVPARIAYEKFATNNGWRARLGRRLRLAAPNREV